MNISLRLITLLLTLMNVVLITIQAGSGIALHWAQPTLALIVMAICWILVVEKMDAGSEDGED